MVGSFQITASFHRHRSNLISQYWKGEEVKRKGFFAFYLFTFSPFNLFCLDMVELKKIKFAILGILGSFIIRLLVRTLRVEERPKDLRQRFKERGEGLIYAFWHRMMLALAYVGKDSNIHVLISQHTDGEYIAQVIKRLGYGVIRGSTTRGGARAMISLVKKAREGFHIAITPDGPRGPRYIVQTGVIYLAQKSGVPILPASLGLSNYWELPSWDRFIIPKPFSKALLLYGTPIYVPPKLTEEQLEEYRLRLQRALEEITKQANAQLQQISS